jgi:ABC-type phosphate transport system ATPase subunit
LSWAITSRAAAWSSFSRTDGIFTAPTQKRTHDYITGRFG